MTGRLTAARRAVALLVAVVLAVVAVLTLAASPAVAGNGPAAGAAVAASIQDPGAGVGAEADVWAGERRGTTTPQPGTTVGFRVAPQTSLEQPCEGMLVYRVYGPGAGAGEFGASWTPVDPRSIGREQYRDLAGLPDSNPGTHLVIGELIDPSAARPRPGGALPCGPPHCAEERPGGLPEYMIENNPVAVANRTYVTLSPPY